MVILEVADRKPLEILRIQYSFLDFDSEGRIVAAEKEREAKLAMEMLPPLVKEVESGHLVDARHKFAQKRYGGVIAWYIMTSPANHETTKQAFEEKNYFGLEADNVVFFQQGMIPCFDQEGKILLAEPHRIALSPDGHGGSLRALHRSFALEDMARRRIEYISYFQVDNPLVKVIDPLFIGLHALDQAQMSSKAVMKEDPEEKVGVLVLGDGKVRVIEYSDLPRSLAQQRNDEGRLTYELGSVAIHIINRSFVEKINAHGFSLPWHRAQKRVPYVDTHGQVVDPQEPNAVKLETFVFDALPLADVSIILAIERAEEFAPIKNAAGADSPESSRRLQIERAARWLEKAGADVPRRPDRTIDAALEISPLFALDVEELAQKGPLLPPIEPGGSIYIE